MAHAHSRTLLASLGFADPDKKETRHDKAIQYLAQPEVSMKLMDAVFTSKDEPCKYRGMLGEVDGVSSCTVESITEYKTEVPLTKGDGKYRSHVGFLDLVVFAVRKTSFTGIDCGKQVSDQQYKSKAVAAVEVKITPVAIGDLIRQINLYREYGHDAFFGVTKWVVATLYKPSDADKATLANARIKHIQLGDGFTKYLEHATAVEPNNIPSSPEI